MIDLETRTAPAVAPETVTPLRPSEALRLGRLLSPVQIFGAASDDAGGSCAWAAILDGGFYGFARHGSAECPARCGARGQLDSRIIHLNDYHHWSDDQIVTWLESLGL